MSAKPQMIRGLVSTIIPVYNRAEMLCQAVDSVLAQDYRPIEVIIVDDGSTDTTSELAVQLSHEHTEIIYIRTNNGGPGLAREAGRRRARGEFIQYLDSDDLLVPNKFTLQVKALLTHPECGTSYGMTSLELTTQGIEIAPWKRTGEEISTILPSMFVARWWGTSTPLYRRAVTDLAGPWKNLINEEDWEYDCRIGLINNRLNYIPQTLSIQRQHNSPRLSNDGSIDPLKLTARAHSRQHILNHALAHGINVHSSEFLTLIKSMFLLSRQCAAAGVIGAAASLFELVKPYLYSAPETKRQAKIYHLGIQLIGAQHMGRLSCYLDRFKK